MVAPEIQQAESSIALPCHPVWTIVHSIGDGLNLMRKHRMTVPGIVQFGSASNPCAPAYRLHDMAAATTVRNLRAAPVSTFMAPDIPWAAQEIFLQAMHSHPAASVGRTA